MPVKINYLLLQKNVSSNRNILITKPLTETLLKWREIRKEIIFSNTGSQKFSNAFVCTNEQGQALNPKTLCLNIPFKFHDFRYPRATILLESGVNIKVIQEKLY